VRKAYGRKRYCSRKETPEEMPKEQAEAGRAVEVIRVTRMRATGMLYGVRCPESLY
jgi:hypothetical protein